MEQLISGIFNLIFSNFEFLLLILFALSSIWFKKKKNEEAREAERRTPRQAPPKPPGWEDAPPVPKSWEDVSPIPTSWEDASKSVSWEEVSPDPTSWENASPSPTNGNQQAEMENFYDSSDTQISSENFARHQPSIKMMENIPTEQDIIRGIMWAEIFGSPRSKTPYRSPMARK